jgi:membrane protein DedA with SNARE-associated domain
MEFFNLIDRYGDIFYVIVTVWTFLEGETVVLFSGIAAREGVLDLYLLIACAWVGSFLGDQVYFLLGRRYGPRLLQRYPRWHPGVKRALNLLERFSAGFILTFRFVYGVRNFSSFAMGMSSLSWRRFALLNFVAAGLWSVRFAGAGYFAGMALQHVIGDYATDLSLGLLAVFLALTLGGALFNGWRRRRTRIPTPTIMPSAEKSLLDPVAGDP